MTHLTEQFHLPDQYHTICDRLTTLVARHTRRLLADEYWADAHLDAIADHAGHSYTYIRDDDHDWIDHTIRLPTYSRFLELLDAGTVKAPTLHSSTHGYTLDVPIDVPDQPGELVADRILAVDLGVKKQATAVVLDAGEDCTEHEQVTPPVFLDHHAKDKLLRVKSDAEGINDRLAQLRSQRTGHTDRFDHLLAEYRRTRRKERRLRHQIQHDIANQLVWLTANYGCETIVFESLGQLDAPDTSGVTAWRLSSWARGDLLENVAYKAELLGISVETVNPWGTSRYCPRCGKRGQTVKAPTDHTELRHGGHFHCPHCGYECDRDVVGAVNVGRKYFDGSRMETANPAEYSSAGNHASVPSHHGCARSAGVQSATDEQDVASGRQTCLAHDRAAPLVTGGGTDTGGLPNNHSRNTAWRSASRSVTQYILASTTDCD